MILVHNVESFNALYHHYLRVKMNFTYDFFYVACQSQQKRLCAQFAFKFQGAVYAVLKMLKFGRVSCWTSSVVRVSGEKSYVQNLYSFKFEGAM